MKVSDSVAFQSNIRLIDQKLFYQKIKHLNPKRHEVGFPWTSDTMKKGKNLFTTGILDCIVVGVKDGTDFILAHLGIYNQEQAKLNHQKGFSISNFERRMLENINLDNENLHAFIIGGKQILSTSTYNVNQLEKVKKFFNKYYIPYSIFGARKDTYHFGEFEIFYENKEDTLYITNSLIDKKSPEKKYNHYKYIELTNNNTVKYTTYERKVKDRIVSYIPKFNEGTVKDFFDSQFRQVSLYSADCLSL